MRSLHDIVAAAGGPSARPDSVLRLMQVLDDPVVEARQLAPIVERDPGLTAGLLKLCNSPLYGFKRRIGTPREALILVGNLTFARLCFTLSLEPILHRELPGYDLDLDSLWRHSLATAYGAAFLMSACGQHHLRDRAFTAGLLHDLGKLALDQELVCHQGFPTTSLHPLTTEVEIQRTGHDHAEVGGAWLKSWDLPEQVVAGVRWHHEPHNAGEHRRLAGAIHIAGRVTRMAGRLQAGSQALESWIGAAFSEGGLFATGAIHGMARTVAIKQENILSLAAGQGL